MNMCRAFYVLASMLCVGEAVAGQWLYAAVGKNEGQLSHDTLGWTLRVAQSGLTLTVKNLDRAPPWSAPLPLGDAVEDGLTIAAIGDAAFSQCVAACSVTIPRSISSIGASAFEGCAALTNVIVESSESGIGVNAFANCGKLTEVTFRGAYPAGGSAPSLVYGSFNGSMNVTTYVRSVFSASWEPRVENGPIAGGQATWQGYPIRIQAATTNGGSWNADSPYVINMNEVVGDGEGYHMVSDKVELTDSGASYLITGSGIATSLAVSVPSGVEAYVTLSNVNINASGRSGVPAFGLASSAVVQLRLAAGNTLVGGNNAAGLQVQQGALLSLSSDPPETGSLLAVGGGSGAGIGSGYGQNAGTVMIGGGRITATGGIGGAGIGGGMWQWPAMIGGGGGCVVISGGGVVATGSHAAAGIGDGEGGDGAVITISGGAVTARGGTSGGACIGGDRWGGGGFVSISGGVIDARGGSGQGEGVGGGTEADSSPTNVIGLISGSNTFVLATAIGAGILRQGGLIFENGCGRLYDDEVTLTSGATIPVGASVVISNAQTFTVGEGVALTNSGAINAYGAFVVDGAVINNGSLRAYGGFAVDGTFVNNGVTYSIEPVVGGGAVAGDVPVFFGEAGSAADPVAVNINAVAAGGPGYTFDGGCLTFFWRGRYLVYGTGEATANRILVSEDTATHLTLSNVTIGVAANYLSAFDVRVNASVTIMLAGTNVLSSGLGAAGLHVPPGASVAIGTLVSAAGERQAGALVAAGGASSAGIGGHLYESAGSVSISGGSVTARGGGSAGVYGGAGIGGGHGGNGGSVLISGGTVIATGNYNAAAIGGGSGGSPANGSISGNAFVVANTAIAGLARLGGVIVEHAAGGLFAGAVAVVADVTLPEDSALAVTNGQTLVIGKGVTFINSGVITNAGAIIVYGTFINNGLVVGNDPQQGEAPSGVIEHLALRPDTVVLAWPGSPAPVSVIYGKEKMTDEWAELRIASSPTNAIMALGRFRFFTRALP